MARAVVMMKTSKTSLRKSDAPVEQRASADSTHETILELAMLVAHLARRVVDGDSEMGERVALPATPSPVEKGVAAQPATSPDDNLIVSEVAAILRLTPQTVREHIKARRLEATLTGRTYRVKRRAVEKFLAGTAPKDERTRDERIEGVLSRLRG